MSTKHTPGHLHVTRDAGFSELRMHDGTIVALMTYGGDRKAQRLADSWNACIDEDGAMLKAIVREGTTVRRRHDEALQRAETYQRELCGVERQRDELLKALEATTSALWLQLEPKHGPQAASEYPEIKAARELINKINAT